MALFVVSASMYTLVLLVPLGIFAAVGLYHRKPRVPSNLPILRISTLPAKQGETADIKAYIQNGSEVVRHGYNQYSRRGQNFLMRTPTGIVFVVAPRFIDEIRNVPESVLSAMSINNATLQVRYTLHPILDYDWYEFEVISKQLTQSLGPGLPNIVDECHKAFLREMGRPTEWTAKHAWPVACRVVTRTANRQFFSERLSENEEFLQLSIDYTYTVFAGAHAIRDYPAFLRPLILRWKTGMAGQKAVAKKHLVPLFQDRIRSMRKAIETGRMADYEREKPNDAVQWLLDVTPPEKMDVHVLVHRMLHLNVSAIHTSSCTFLDAIYDLALHPEIHEELQQEIVSVMNQQGKWTKQGLTKMIKMDSFIKESARWHPFLAGSMERQAMRDYILSDGSTITKGTKLTVPHYAMFFDDQIYGPTAHKFDAFRFSKMRAEAGQESKHSFVQCTPTFTHFGYGKHACPGRFFAVNEIKVLLVYMLSMFDIRWPEGQREPAEFWFGGYRSPDKSLPIEWRLRDKPLLQLP